MTNAPVTQTAAPTTTQKVYFDKKATVLNKGGYTAELELVYYNPTRTVQKGTILSLQGYAFCNYISYLFPIYLGIDC